MPWNPDQYHKFQAERFAPFEDLFSLINVRPGMRVIDLGCGTGELTAKLADRLPGSQVLGIDNSSQMLERAQAHKRPGLSFELQSIESTRRDERWDLVFSHAALQWVDDHEALLPMLLSIVRPGGQIAVQMPSNHRHLTQTLIRDIASEEPFKGTLGGWTRTSPVLSIGRYAELLYNHEASQMTVFEKVYPHLVEDASAVAEWTSGTVMVPYFERLPEELHKPFMDEYKRRLGVAFPQTPVFYGFQRTLFAATAG